MAATKIPTTADAAKALATIDTSFPEVYQIGDADQLVGAGDILKRIKARQTELTALRKTMTLPLDQAKKAILDLFREPEQRLANAESSLKRGILDYNRQVEIERRRLEAELRDQQAEEAARLQAEADELRERGKEEAAEALVDSIPPVPVVVMDTPRLDGISTRKTWKAEVVDFEVLVLAAAEGHVPMEYLLPNEVLLNATARSLKQAAHIPGVRVYEDTGVAVRA